MTKTTKEPASQLSLKGLFQLSTEDEFCPYRENTSLPFRWQERAKPTVSSPLLLPAKL